MLVSFSLGSRWCADLAASSPFLLVTQFAGPSFIHNAGPCLFVWLLSSKKSSRGSKTQMEGRRVVYSPSAGVPAPMVDGTNDSQRAWVIS